MPTSRSCSGRPVAASTQMSTRAIDDAASAGTTRSPSASRPAIRSASIRDSSPGSASASSRRLSVFGNRSGASGSASGAAGVRVTRFRSYSQVTEPDASRYTPVSPPAVTTSTLLSVGPRHQTRIVVRELNRSATLSSSSVSGSARAPMDSAYPENRTDSLAIAAARRSTAERSASAAGHAATTAGAAASTATSASTRPHRRAAPVPRAMRPPYVRVLCGRPPGNVRDRALSTCASPASPTVLIMDSGTLPGAEGCRSA